MALFGKKKEDEKKVAPPPLSDNQAAPPMGQSTNGTIAPPPAPTLQQTGNLSVPPIPGGSLDDIKNQVTQQSYPQESGISIHEGNIAVEPVSLGKIESISNDDIASDKIESNNNDDIDSSMFNDDSLFDLSDLDTTSSNEQQKDTTKDSNSSSTDVSFINTIKRKVSQNETFFVTTKQFKQLLEIIESVKNRVKGANEIHLKLLDIKAEEDIEYENLRKDFQFIEEKLYEIDNVIFEN